jgi:hypothetical protein
MKVLRDGIPGWYQKRYPVEGAPPVGGIQHRPYPQAVEDIERRLNAQVGGGRSARFE